MFRWIKAAAAAWLALQASSALATTGLKMISTPGDDVGQGLSYTYVPKNSTVSGVLNTLPATGYRVLKVNLYSGTDSWTLYFSVPADATFAPGSYPDAQRADFANPTGFGLDVSGNGSGCNSVLGWFQIKEFALASDGFTLKKLAVDFVQNCDTVDPPLYGSLRLNSQYQLSVPTMAAVAGRDFAVLSGQTAVLDGTQSFKRGNNAVLNYQWTQIAGPTVTLSNPASVTPSFTAINSGPDPIDLQFQLVVTDSSGKTSSDDVVVVVESPTAPQTAMTLRGTPGDFVTGGLPFDFSSYNAVMDFLPDNIGGINLYVYGDYDFDFDIEPPPGQKLKVQNYTNVQRAGFQTANHAGLEVGASCNTVTGYFNIDQLQWDQQGNPTQLEVEFQQHCDGLPDYSYGQVLLNAVPQVTIAAQLRSARQRLGRRR